MTKRSKKPINKVLIQGLVTFLAPLLLVLIRTYVWTDMPANLDGPFHAFVLSLVITGVSSFAGYMTPHSPTEIVDISKSLPEARAQIEQADIETKHGTLV